MGCLVSLIPSEDLQTIEDLVQTQTGITASVVTEVYREANPHPPAPVAR